MAYNKRKMLNQLTGVAKKFKVKDLYAQAKKMAGRTAATAGAAVASHYYGRKGKTYKKNQRVRTSTSAELAVANGSIVLKKNLVGKTKGNWKLEQIEQGYTFSQAGMQKATTILGVVNKNTLTTASPSFGFDTSIQKLGDLNPYRNTSGSGIFGSGVPANDRFGLKTIDIEIEFCNGGNTAALVDIYYVMPKNNTSTIFEDMWNTACINESMGSALITRPAPGKTTVAGPLSLGGRPDSLFPGQTPFTHKLMRDNWKVLKKVQMNLQVGVNQVIKQHVKYNKVIQPDSLLIADGGVNIKGHTINVIVVQRGIVGWDKTETEKVCTYAHSEIGFVIKQTYNMCGVFGNAGRLDIGYAAQAIPANTTYANMHHVTEDGTDQAEFGE